MNNSAQSRPPIVLHLREVPKLTASNTYLLEEPSWRNTRSGQHSRFIYMLYQKHKDAEKERLENLWKKSWIRMIFGESFLSKIMFVFWMNFKQMFHGGSDQLTTGEAETTLVL